MAAFEHEERPEVELHGVLAEFRTALREELEAARRAASSGAVQLVNGRKIGQFGLAFQYLFFVESALNVPEDSPGDLRVPGRPRVETTIISVDGLAITLSVASDLGEFVPRAALESNLTHLLRMLIQRIEAMADKKNPAGDRLLGLVEPSGEPASLNMVIANGEQARAVASSIGRDTTFIWGPPGTGKTRTIGHIGAELMARSRTLLVVSHTNAAVDQAVIRVADELGEEAVQDGAVLRLGETKDQALQARPWLLAETHIARRSEALVVEREALNSEKSELMPHVLELQRLIGIWDWLPMAVADIAAARDRLSALLEVQRLRDEARAAFEVIESEAAVVLPRAEAGRRAESQIARLAVVNADLTRLGLSIPEIEREHETAAGTLSEAHELHRLVITHAASVVAARARQAELVPDVEAAQAALTRARDAHEANSAELASATELLARSLEASGLVRRWKGLPKPEEQEPIVARLRDRHATSEAVLESCAAAVASLEQEISDTEAIVSQWGHLPAAAAQQGEVERLRAEEAGLRQQREREHEQLASLQVEAAEIGDPRQAFVSEHAVTPPEAIRAGEAIEPRLRYARTIAGELGADAGTRRRDLEAELGIRLAALREWELSELRSGSAEEMLEEIEQARERAESLVAGTEQSALQLELNALNGRLREIDGRLEQIEDEFQRLEEVVVAEAKVVATTLTRAYKRESVQKRRFDTVILDEASMAPIPALWIAASLADANVVIVGDFRQLPPIKHSDHPLAEKWLGQDIFDVSGVREAFDSGESPPFFVQLREQWRMHPQISAIPNHFFYGGALRDTPGIAENDAALDGWYERGWGHDAPVLLMDTGSLNAWVTSVNIHGRTSRLNFLSATACVDLAEMMLRPGRADPEGGKPRILIGAPYRPQAKLLGLLLRDQRLEPDVVAGTAHTFQGSEAPVMIFDLVNDEPHWRVGMFWDARDGDFERLLNVALTRAQRRLVVVGDLDYIAYQGRKAFIGRLLGYLRDTYPTVDAAGLLPAGLSARAARAQVQGRGWEVERPAQRIVVTQADFDRHWLPDLAAAAERIIIYSPFLTNERVGSLEAHLRAAIERGVRVWVVTKGLAERGGGGDNARRIEQALVVWGVRVVHKAKMHEKLVFVDDSILWSGSLNPLSFSDTQEVMERRHSREVVESYEQTLRLPDLIGAYDAGETTCPFCGGEIVAAEGRDEPFYWRCVNAGCFTRSIGQPMPRDGKVVCSSPGCGGEVYFGSWGDNHVWRCRENDRHRTRIVKSHIRLPKMREIVPKRELKKLQREFGIGDDATPVRPS